MDIIGYSERGIINALMFRIGRDKILLGQFIQLFDLKELKGLGSPVDYEILLEQSFSGFGDADLIIIIEYESCKKIVFIEGKVKTFQPKSWSLKKQFEKYKNGKYNGYSSNLFYQLYLKHLLFENISKLNWEKDEIVNSDSILKNCGIRDRKIGKNKVVWKALKKIDVCNEAFYIGLVPTSASEQENIEFNEKLNFKVHFLPWKNVEEFCDYNNLEDVKRIFDFNRGQIY